MKKTALAVFFHLCRCRRNNPSRLHWQRCIAIIPTQVLGFDLGL